MYKINIHILYWKRTFSSTNKRFMQLISLGRSLSGMHQMCAIWTLSLRSFFPPETADIGVITEAIVKHKRRTHNKAE